MSILLIAKNRDMTPFREKLLDADPNLDVEIWPDINQKERVHFAVAWNHPQNVWHNYPNLKVISSLGAGVDHLVNDESIPKSVSLARIVTHSLKCDMADFVLNSVHNLLQNRHHYYQQQQKAEWKQHQAIQKNSVTVGLMGLGEIGQFVGGLLTKNGFNVTGWSRGKKEIDGIKSFSQNELKSFLNETTILVCLLPLTSETEDILDLELFKKLRKPAFLINAGRGEHLVEEDLLYALDTNILKGAALDVFCEEPLPDRHPFWNRKNIIITPHIAALSDPEETADQILENYKRTLSGLPLLNKVDSDRGY